MIHLTDPKWKLHREEISATQVWYYFADNNAANGDDCYLQKTELNGAGDTINTKWYVPGAVGGGQWDTSWETNV